MTGKKRLHVGLLMLALLGTTWAAHAEVYKWVDADGKIQYGDDPPKGVKTQKVSGGVTVVPATQFTGKSSSASKSAAKESTPAEEPRQTEARQSSSASSVDQAAEARRKAIERCEKNRGTDCEEEADSVALPNGEVYRPVPGWSRPPIRPNPRNEAVASSSASSRPAAKIHKVPTASQSEPRK